MRQPLQARSDNQNSLRANTRGPTLLEDFVLREKITHFDHERIPERIVHARGTGVHGFFELTESLESMHMVMWVMSDRTIPRSLRMIEGFGVHSFRLVNEAGA